MSQEDLAAFLWRHKIRLDRDLGQHFLRDESVLREIVNAANVMSMDHIVEIGAGIGILTVELLRRAGRVTAIELDQRLIPLLKEEVNRKLQTANCHLDIIQGNALQTPMPDAPYKIVANIPYHITSPLLRHVFLESDVHPKSLTLLIQREVAEKICDTENAGILTILVALFGKPRIVRIVPPGAFIPQPNVESAVLHVDCFDLPRADRATIERIFGLTKVAFAQKRKMLRNTLGAFQGGAELLSRLQIDKKRRPQTLSLDEWIALAKAWSED